MNMLHQGRPPARPDKARAAGAAKTAAAELLTLGDKALISSTDMGLMETPDSLQ